MSHAFHILGIAFVGSLAVCAICASAVCWHLIYRFWRFDVLFVREFRSANLSVLAMAVMALGVAVDASYYTYAALLA